MKKRKAAARKRSAGRKGGVDYHPPYEVIAWKDNRVIMLDQRLLPNEESYVSLETHADVSRAISDMVIRVVLRPSVLPVPMGCALGAMHLPEKSVQAFQKKMDRVFQEISGARPTAVNLGWAVSRMRENCFGEDWEDTDSIKSALVKEALEIQREDLEINWKLGHEGSALIEAGARVLTYCNAGTLATGGYGTALGVIRACFRKKKIEVFSCETRPFLQGARLTVWELMKERLPVTLITDNMAGALMREEGLDCVVVGADRVCGQRRCGEQDRHLHSGRALQGTQDPVLRGSALIHHRSPVPFGD